MWPTITEKVDIAGPIVAKYYPLCQGVGMRRYASLSNINPSGKLYNSFFVYVCVNAKLKIKRAIFSQVCGQKM